MKKLEKFFDILGEILAIVMILVYLVWAVNSAFHFIDNAIALSIIEFLRAWGSLILIAVVGMEAMSKRSGFLRTIFYVIVALVVIFMFFPATWASIIDAAGTFIK